jgi:chitinase
MFKINILYVSFLFSTFLYSQQNPYYVIAYYTGSGEAVKQHPVEKLTHIIYSFLKLQNDTLTFRNEEQKEHLKKLVALKMDHPDLKIMVSIGGWGGCYPCSGLFASDAHRKTFAKTAVALFDEYNIDGLDLDWEYPAIEGYPGHPYIPEDRNNFTELIKTLRDEMGNKYLLSFAAGGFDRFLENSVDWQAVIPLVDFVNLMTYDLVSGYSTVTGHHTPLMNNTYQHTTTDHCVTWLVKNQVPSEKLIIGAAFYARVWENVPDIQHGIYQSGKFKQGVPYRNFDTYFNPDSGWVYYRDEEAGAAYRYSSHLNRFATFDDNYSILLKTEYVKKKNLRGIMFWELSQDKSPGGLLDTISSNLK